jgi:hypothetical protein
VNPIVLPGEVIGERGILVYLIAGTKKENVVVYGKHYRVLVSDDGKKAIRIEPLTKSALESPITPKAGPEGSKPAGLIVTHLLGDYPLETHVFINMLHKLPLYVSADKYLWRIDKGKIYLISVKGAN